MRIVSAAFLAGLLVSSAPAFAQYEKELGPLASAATSQILPGWTATTRDGWFVLNNQQASGSEQTLMLTAGPAPDQGRATRVAVAVTSSKPSASIGLFATNPAENAICLMEIMADKSAKLFCMDNGKRLDIANVPNAAKLDGSDVIEMVDVPGVSRFLLNGKTIGDVQASRALGAQIGVMAYDVGMFAIANFSITSDGQNVPTQPFVSTTPRSETPQTADTGTQQQPQTGAPTQAGSGNLSGPLPDFEGDTNKIASVYFGLMRSIFAHEFGHALIGELQLPSTGPEEDAVDIYSALQIVEPTMYPSGDKQVDDMAVGSATYAALQWYYSGKINEMKGSAPSPWQDEHTADLKRFRNMMCIMYGGNPKVFSNLADSVNLDERTRARCSDEFNKQNRAWRKILAPHTRSGEWHPEGEQPADAPGAVIKTVFEPSKSRVGDYYYAMLSKALTGYFNNLSQTYVLPRPITVTFRDCDQLNAWYDPKEGSITMCYDLFEHLAVMISDVESGTVRGEPATETTTTSAPAAGNTSGGGTAIDELRDEGIAASMVLFQAPYTGPTPNKHARATIITTVEVVKIIANGRKTLFIDTSGLQESLQNAYSLTDAGRDGSVTDGLQQALDEWLNEKAGGDRSVGLVFFGKGMRDRSSYNAALRAATLGWTTFWYRGGLEAWTANGLPVSK
ncbi:DUF4344 domain-containing metallopeptidase [Brucella pseudogrignonensis]|uniref:Rhodanese domain-containing protein n=1 Tax=Brucella pseudogrignonensis TaxID=419475 RepID=A0ABU1MFJ3_9HYPH|nr:DUF4344 domain-containing metallopeptidase [Brucella pseudogrignonensis]MDR6434813.1 hypothetical protein [Brucella pseudogrignonensis]